MVICLYSNAYLSNTCRQYLKKVIFIIWSYSWTPHYRPRKRQMSGLAKVSGLSRFHLENLWPDIIRAVHKLLLNVQKVAHNFPKICSKAAQKVAQKLVKNLLKNCSKVSRKHFNVWYQFEYIMSGLERMCFEWSV